ncbi:kinase-like domain, phloem protein 2-like protein, partial [Tanacetum coccineum]
YLNQNEDVAFEFILESFSSHHCGDGAIYVEGIEFRAIDNVKHEEMIKKLMKVEQVQNSNTYVDQVLGLLTTFHNKFMIQKGNDELFWLGEVNGKKLLMVSAEASLYQFSDANNFTSISSAQSRFREVIELLPQQIFKIRCTIESQMLSPDIEYVCYLVFKLSKNCQGLCCPVKVRDVLHQENNEAEFIYFITPSVMNIHEITRFPIQREDGWMEIQLWKFKSTREPLSINMKFTSLEGIMAGLIVCALEFRPM